jgi:hypothetical protein
VQGPSPGCAAQASSPAEVESSPIDAPVDPPSSSVEPSPAVSSVDSPCIPSLVDVLASVVPALVVDEPFVDDVPLVVGDASLVDESEPDAVPLPTPSVTSPAHATKETSRPSKA